MLVHGILGLPHHEGPPSPLFCSSVPISPLLTVRQYRVRQRDSTVAGLRWSIDQSTSVAVPLTSGYLDNVGELARSGPGTVYARTSYPSSSNAMDQSPDGTVGS